jgi:hypothetical protein
LLELRLGQAEEIAAELVLRVLANLGPENGATLLDRCEASNWDIKIEPARFEAEQQSGLQRRHALSPAVRDVERTLGRMKKHEDYLQAWQLLT